MMQRQSRTRHLSGRMVSSLLLGVGVIPLIGSFVCAQQVSTIAPVIQMAPIAGLPVMNVQLSDRFGKPYIPNGPVPLRISISGAVKDERTVTLTPDKPWATLSLPKTTVGTVDFNAVDWNSKEQIFPVSAQFNIPKPNSAPGHIKIDLHVIPASVLLIGNIAKLVAKVIGEDNQAAQSPEDLTISFPGAETALKPTRINIPRNEQYGEADLAASTSGTITLDPVVQPPTINGMHIETSPKITVGFFPPPAQLSVAPINNALGPPLFGSASTDIEIVLLDSKGNHVESTGVRDVLLGVTPTGAGRLDPSTLTVQPGQDHVTTKYFPTQGGAATIQASVNGIPSGKTTVVFSDYPWWGGPLIWLVMVGGVFGALAKAAEQNKLQRKAVLGADIFMKFLPTGLLGTFIAFLFGTTLLRTDIQQAFFQSSSHQVVSIYWGIFGGYVGPLSIVKTLASK